MKHQIIFGSANKEFLHEKIKFKKFCVSPIIIEEKNRKEGVEF